VGVVSACFVVAVLAFGAGGYLGIIQGVKQYKAPQMLRPAERGGGHASSDRDDFRRPEPHDGLYKENKDQVIADYLNNVYFGGNAYGVEVASEAYFNKSVPDLAVVR
jgi:transglycosylase-like protein